MKFLCPQCKAKYRIADEKLAQRASSRMKCRKCGHVIDIQSATVPDSMRPPAPGDSDDTEDDVEPHQPPRVAMKSGAGVAPRRAASTSTATAKRPAPPKRGAASPPRRGGAAIAEAVSEKAALPEEEEYPAETARLAPKAETETRKSDFEEEQPTRIHDGALAAAFSLAESGAAVSPAVSAGEDWYVGINGTPAGPIGSAQIRDHAKNGSVNAESLVWRDGFEEWKPLKEFPELLALVQDTSVIAAAAEAARAAPAASPADETLKPGPSSESMSEQLSGAKRRSTSHPMAWVAVFVALALGVTIGGVLLSKVEKQEVVKYVEVPASAKAADTAAASDTVLEEQSVAGGGTKHVGSSSAPKPEPSAAPAAKGLSTLNGLNGLNGLGPATQGPEQGTQSAAPGGQLDGTSIQRTVAGFSPGVRRGCWDTALAARAPDAPSTARVGLTITISPSGSVDDVTTTGDPKGYPNLARCIESKVRGWHFPRSSGTTTANVPFVFAAQ